MKLTTDQEKAYDGIMKWMSGKGDWCYKLAGYAGTGKTTLLQHIINGMDDVPFCCAPTGKAASVLESKLSSDAVVTTVHKALYAPVAPCTEKIEAMIAELKKNPDNAQLRADIAAEKKEMSKQKLSFTSKLKNGEYEGRTFITDEASMINKKMADDFKYSGARVLFVGDPGQLPPVGDGGWFGNGSPDYTLEKVMRQALDNPIIRLSMDIRKNGYCSPAQYTNCPEVKIVKKSDLPVDEWLAVDQVLTGSNYLRRRINRFFRKQYGYEEQTPLKGEKLICLKNDFEHYGLINGIPATCSESAYVDDDGELRMSALFEDEIKTDMAIYTYPFEAHYKTNAQEDPWIMRRSLAEFDWAYAITVHKSQGSEWKNVLLADDGFFSRNMDDRKKWLYTAITRAKENLIWVQE